MAKLHGRVRALGGGHAGNEDGAEQRIRKAASRGRHSPSYLASSSVVFFFYSSTSLLSKKKKNTSETCSLVFTNFWRYQKHNFSETFF